MEMETDRLSELPDSLLIHILSFLGVKRAGVTSLLSKRWKYLWSELPKLDFYLHRGTRIDPESARDIVSWINRTIAIRKGNYLESFLVNFRYYKCNASDVDSWVEFSVKSKVKELILEFFTHKDSYYTLPQLMYSCPSLTTLRLVRCIMPYEGTIKWKSLTSLDLYKVKLNQHLLDEILSSCPVLNDLGLRSSWGFNRLEVKSRCVNCLIIDEDAELEQETESSVEVSAPYVRTLHIGMFPHGKKWQLRNISAVVTASIDFFGFDGDGDDDFLERMDNVEKLLENFKHVNDLVLYHVCFEVLSQMVVNGWQLPLFKLQHLRIDICSEFELTVPGIICLLDCSPNIETLLLDGNETEGGIADLYPYAKDDLDGDLLHLKKIRVNNFADPDGEPLLTLAEILLKRAPALEEMVIVADVSDTSDFINMSQTLLTYTRSSTKAKVHLSRK